MSEPDDPTELAGMAEMGTESITAWSLEDDTDDYPTPRHRGLSTRAITALAVAASLCILGAAGLVINNYIRERHAAPTPTVPSAAQAPSSSAHRAPSSNSESSVIPAPSSKLEQASTPAPFSTPQALPERTVTTPPSSTSAVESGLTPAEEQLLANLRRYGVPVSEADPLWTASLAWAVCATARDGGPGRYPPGTDTMTALVQGVMDNNPGWTRQQASRLVLEAVNTHCPEMTGPSPQQIAAMPPDQRYLAMLADQLGITPVDGSLVRGAQQICALWAQGWYADQIAREINSPNSEDDERIIVDIATKVYCPQYSGR
jgi:hypothetical protein